MNEELTRTTIRMRSKLSKLLARVKKAERDFDAVWSQWQYDHSQDNRQAMKEAYEKAKALHEQYTEEYNAELERQFGKRV